LFLFATPAVKANLSNSSKVVFLLGSFPQSVITCSGVLVRVWVDTLNGNQLNAGASEVIKCIIDKDDNRGSDHEEEVGQEAGSVNRMSSAVNPSSAVVDDAVKIRSYT